MSVDSCIDDPKMIRSLDIINQRLLILVQSPILKGEGFMDGSLYEIFYFRASVYQSFLRHWCLRYFIFQISGRRFQWHPKFWGVFSDILTTASRLNTLYGLWRQHHLYWLSYEFTHYQTCCHISVKMSKLLWNFVDFLTLS